MWKLELASAVYVEPSKDNSAGVGAGAGVMRDWVLAPTMAILEERGRDIGVPDTVTAPPCIRV